MMNVNYKLNTVDFVVEYICFNLVMAVLVKRIDGWTAYINPINGYDVEQDCIEVASFGTKLPESIAIAMFPNAKQYGSFCS